MKAKNNSTSKTLFCLLIFSLGSFLSCGPSSETLVILFSNDTHGSFQPHKLRYQDEVRLVGGMEAASHYINQIREQEENVLLIDTGDIMTGTLAAVIEYDRVRGGAMPEFLNRLGYDIRTHGNHAFDLGQANVKAIEGITDSPLVLANLVYQDSQELFASAAYHVLEKGRWQIGVIAVMEENFKTEVYPDNVKGLEVLPIIPTLNKYIPEIREQADLVIVLVHSKFFDGEMVAEEVPGIDIVLVASEDAQFAEINGVLISSTYGHQQTLGCLKLTLKKGKIVDHAHSLIWLWADIDLQPSPEITSLVKDMESSFEDEYMKVIGQTDFEYKCPGYDSIENSLGNWITDVMRWKTGTDIGIHNSGGIRSDIFAGPISKRTLYEVSPFQNNLVTFELTGAQLKEIFERDVERGRDRIQVSGLRYNYFPKYSKPFGQRIDFLAVGKDVVVGKGKVLLPQKIFTAVSNDYVVGHAEGKFFGFEVSWEKSTNLHLNQVLEEWLEMNQTLVCSIEDRIVQLEPIR